MPVNLIFRNSTTDKKYDSKFFEEILNAAARELKFGNKKVELSLNLVKEDKIKELNKRYRNKNKITDVLSFPMNDKSPINDMGDIFICLSFAKKEAKRENIDINKKLARLAVHGFLHLAGYDHEKSEKEAEVMFNLENKILSKLSF